MLAITDPLRSFYFDRVVTNFGREVEAAMDAASEGSKNRKDSARKRAMALARFMRTSDGTHAPGTFRDPMALRR